MNKFKLEDKIKKIFEVLFQPIEWFDFLLQKKRFFLYFSIYILIGFILQHIFPFPKFYIFSTIFLLIEIIALYSLYYYSDKMRKIIGLINEQPFAHGANIMYLSYIRRNFLYVFFPVGMLLIFGIGGCKMYTSIKYNLCTIWILSLFSFVVYISLVGYLQYFFLFIYIMKLAHSDQPYKNIQHSLNECIPAELEWLQTITKLYHVYRSAFFSLGSLYIIAFYLFCFMPEMKTNINSPYFLILWTIIFVAIVLMFPCTAILQYYWIKKIVEKIKKQYVEDLTREITINNQKNTSINIMQRKLFEIIYVTQIFNSKDYPINSIFNVGYNFCISIFNLGATIITILQGFSILSIDFLQIF